jgi:hypothetical protein
MRNSRMMARRFSFFARIAAVALGVFLLGLRPAGAVTVVTTLMQLSTGSPNFGYAGSSTSGDNGDINSCSVDLDNLITAGNYQYVAYYGPLSSTSQVFLARRAIGTTNWSVINAINTANTNLAIGSDSSNSAGNTVQDDHNVIALGVDSSGFMHVAWGMHNTNLSAAGASPGYYISSAPVNGSSWSTSGAGAIKFAKQNTLVGANENEVTYPSFYNLPGSTQLLFSYRQGGAGGGSGNGDQYFDRYDPGNHTFTSTRVINGMDANVNAYLNNMTYDSQGNLLMTWTWRATSNWQTNSNIMFAQSPDNGVTWYKQGGATQYALPIIQSGSPVAAVAQTVWNIPQQSSFINQTSMTVDNNDHPIVATWWAPGTTGSTNAQLAPNQTTNNPNRQYMLVYYDGSQWRKSQVSNRTSDTVFDTGGGSVRDLGRPLVMVDKQNRVLVVMRYRDASNPNNHDPNNSIVLAYNEDLMTGNVISDANWKYLTLSTANMGNYEPTFDASMWKTSGILDLFYEPSMGVSPFTTQPVSILEWNEQQFFAALHPHLGDFNLDGTVTNADIQPMLDAITNLASYKSAHGLSDADLLALGDINGDHTVDQTDIPAFLNLLAGNGGGAGAVAVPEPATGWLFGLGSLALVSATGSSKSRIVKKSLR